MRWITRQNVKADRVACPWLIKRFIDPGAEFLFVPDAMRFSEVRLNHRGERCTFEVILEDYNLGDPALHRLGLIVRGADVQGQEEFSPESLGLRAIAQGFALSAHSDEERLAHKFPIYDALLEYVRQSLSFDSRARSASSPPDLWRFFR